MTNRITFEKLRHLSSAEYEAIPVDELLMLQDDLDELKAEVKEFSSLLAGVMSARYQSKADELRHDQGKEAGTVRIKLGKYTVVCDVPKKITWDQSKLKEAIEQVKSWGSDPDDFVTTEIKVSETKYNAWPTEIRKAFIDARTSGVGKATYEIVSNEKGE